MFPPPTTPSSWGRWGRTAINTGVAAGRGLASAVAVPVAGTAALAATGFKSAGIAAGSLAAGIKSGVGYVAAGSWGRLGRTATNTGVVAVTGIASAVAVPPAATAALAAVGFKSAGIAAGSWAAGKQAGIGCVAAGSWFAAAQSTGALGGFAILGPVGLVAGIGAAGITYYLVSRNRFKSKL